MGFETTPNFKNCVWSACICQYTSCEIENILVGCAAEGDCLCSNGKGCCGVPNEANPMMPVGMAKVEGNICTISLPCCQQGLKVPTVLCAQSTQCLCIKQVQSFPFNKDFVAGPVCALCGIQCCPKAGLLQPYEGGPSAQVVAR